jgi:hypothetical protein
MFFAIVGFILIGFVIIKPNNLWFKKGNCYKIEENGIVFKITNNLDHGVKIKTIYNPAIYESKSGYVTYNNLRKKTNIVDCKPFEELK